MSAWRRCTLAALAGLCVGVAVALALRDEAGVQGRGGCGPASARAVAHAVNRQRRRRELARLELAPDLVRSAERFAQHIAAGGGFEHHDRIELPRRYRWRGEVLAYGRCGAAATVRQWMGSPPHRAVLLAPQPRWLGAGRARWGRRTVWVAHFGRLR